MDWLLLDKSEQAVVFSLPMLCPPTVGLYISICGPAGSVAGRVVSWEVRVTTAGAFKTLEELNSADVRYQISLARGGPRVRCFVRMAWQLPPEEEAATPPPAPVSS